MENKEILRKRVDELASRVSGSVEESLDFIVLTVQAPYISEVLNAVKNFEEVPCDFLHDIAGVDKLEHLEVVYHLTSLRGTQKLRVKAIVDREKPVIDSVVKIWPGANFMEREAYDMFGIVFTGHPNLRRIYMWDDFEGFPLRKDYVTEPPEVRDVMRVRRDED